MKENYYPFLYYYLEWFELTKWISGSKIIFLGCLFVKNEKFDDQTVKEKYR